MSTVPQEEIQQQSLSFNALVKDLGKATSSEIRAVLAERATVLPDNELDSNTVAILQQRMQDSANV